jgi:hypothetical protein
MDHCHESEVKNGSHYWLTELQLLEENMPDVCRRLFLSHMNQVSSVKKVVDCRLEDKSSIPSRIVEDMRWVLEALSLR